MTNLYSKKVLETQDLGIEQERVSCFARYGNEILQTTSSVFNKTQQNSFCPPFWDGILCWPQTIAGELATQNCPSFVAGFSQPNNNASRQCTESGQWYMKGNDSWTNYTACSNGSVATIYVPLNKTHIDRILEENALIVEIIAETGYIVSLFTLIIAFLIMLFIKKLHCPRNILHMHLFASFILRAFIFLIKKTAFVDGLGLPSDFFVQNGSRYFNIKIESNNWTCKLVISLWQYFVTANYSWILMEGLYLHNLIFRALFVDYTTSVKWYIIMGWGFPLKVIGSWIAARVIYEDNLCWTTAENKKVFMIIFVPTVISVLLNLGLFVRISIVLYHKLRSPINEDSRRYQKWMKSTLVLVPLFGVNYALLLSLYYWTKTNPVIEIIWLICDAFFGSFQGFFVAVLYCFLNGEVKSEIQPHLYIFLTYLATGKYSKNLFPCRKKFLRSLVGRSSVCTTMSCSSLYTNGVLHRNSKCRLDSAPKPKAEKTTITHCCQIPSRRRHSANLTNSVETTLCFESSSKRDKDESDEETSRNFLVRNDF